MNIMQSWLNSCSTGGNEVSSEQSRGQLVGSQQAKLLSQQFLLCLQTSLG